MKDTVVKARMCGVPGLTARPGVSAGACGAGPGDACRPAAGTGFAIRPMRPGHRRSLDCALRMGHCAPAVMAALIDDSDPGRDSAVLLASAMAGGIGNSGRECGALTSSVLYLGQQYGREAVPGRVSPAVALSQRLIERFREIHGGIHCDDIRKGGKNPLPCMRAMVSAPEIVGGVIGQSASVLEEAGHTAGDARLLSGFEARSFHCVHSVFSNLAGIVPECDRLRDMTYPFIGGIALTGGTCSAAAAGVLAIGLATGKIEDGYLRVVMMMARMLSGGDMMADSVNNFNPAINRGQALMDWFEGEYGDVLCANLTGIDIRESETADRYLAGSGIDRCEAIAAAVATKTREIIGDVK